MKLRLVINIKNAQLINQRFQNVNIEADQADELQRVVDNELEKQADLASEKGRHEDSEELSALEALMREIDIEVNELDHIRNDSDNSSTNDSDHASDNNDSDFMAFGI